MANISGSVMRNGTLFLPSPDLNMALLQPAPHEAAFGAYEKMANARSKEVCKY